MTKRISKKSKPGLQISRFFSTASRDPFTEVEWEQRDAIITGESGKVYFEQKDVEFPKTWSQLATNVVVQKYFRGAVGTPTRECSVRQLIGRVVSTITGWGLKDGYFRTEQDAEVFRSELTHLLIHQKMAFNSPVWFNVGVETEPQCSACFINSVQDTMDSILTLAKTEGMLFKFGSGTGTNFSSIRSSRESLQGGGGASGPVSFMKGFDAFAGVIKSGGKCLAPHQRIYTIEEGPVEIRTLAEQGKDFHVISYDPPSSRYLVKSARAWKEGTKQVVSVLTDCGTFDLSEDHPVRLSSGMYREAGKLQQGDFLFACRVTDTEREVTTHRVVQVTPLKSMEVYDVEVDCPTEDDKTPQSGHNFLIWDGEGRFGSGVVVSNTRRAAKMVILNADHPDILEYIHCKSSEEKKAWALIDAGYDGSFNGEAYNSIFFQNSNNSVRVTDSFMESVVHDRPWQTKSVTRGEVVDSYRARDIWRQIAEAAHQCGDPGLQFDTTVNSWHPCPNSGRINASNPCCFTADMLVDTSEGPLSFAHLMEMSEQGKPLPLAFSFDQDTGLPVLRQINHIWEAGQARQLAIVETEKGHRIRCTPEHRFLLRGGTFVEAQNLKPGMSLRKIARWSNPERGNRHYLNFRSTPECPSGTKNQARWIWEQVHGPLPADTDIHHLNGICTDDRLSNLSVISSVSHREIHAEGSNNPRFLNVKDTQLVEVWDTIEGQPRITHKASVCPVTPSRWNNFIRKNNLQGIVPFARGDGRIQGMSWEEFSEKIRNLRKDQVNDQVKSVVLVESNEPVYDLEVEGTHTFGVMGSEDREDSVLHSIIVHNSEYMFLDDSACNLASLNLRKFQFPVGHPQAGDFDIDSFEHAVDLTILAQEIIVDNARYPTDKIGENSHLYRPLGLGYANLGALLMSRGLPYDSDAGRAYAGAITAIMGGRAYRMSAEISRDHGGPFAGYEKNREPFLGVMRKHRQHVDHIDSALCPYDLLQAARAAWEEAILFGERYGFRNGQSTVLAPTGTIGFMMDCDTTGIEPDIALVKYKRLVGGGLLKITNQTVGEALTRLGYDATAQKQITDYIATHDTIEGASGLRPEHLSVFDCAFRAQNGTRSIHPMGHIKMMAAAQPFISGAISKTVNLPSDATIEDIENAYMQAWQLGLKAIAIYRDGCKRSQPLSTSKTEKVQKVERVESKSPLSGEVQREIQNATSVEDLLERIANLVKPTGQPMAVRRKLPDERRSITHKFTIAGHEGYLHVGMYDDGSPGEIFIRMAKEGSTISGLMDSFATAVSLALQHGVPLKLLVDKFSRTRFEPSGWTGNSEIPRASSIMDYLFRWLEAKFLTEGSSEPTDSEIVNRPYRAETDAPMCSECGSMMVRSGTCHRCTNCGSTSGCG